VDLADVVGRTTDVVLDQVATFEDGDLGGLGPTSRTSVAPDRSALRSRPARLGILIDLGQRTGIGGCHPRRASAP
jgi:hypothetical protein